MSDGKKQKGNWRLLLTGVILISVIAIGAFWIHSGVVNRAKIRLWADWTGFGEIKAITTITIEEDQKGKIKKTLINKQIRPEKTLWNILDLSGKLAIPILLVFFGRQFQKRYKLRAEKQARLEREQTERQNELKIEIAKDNLAEETIQSYLDSMANLLLNKELRKELFPNVVNQLNHSGCSVAVRSLLQLKTITILKRLKGDTKRQARIIDFLRDAELDKFILKNANLSEINLSRADLRKANLQEAYLSWANLQFAKLESANLQYTVLWSANLQFADLRLANFERALLLEANLQFADLRRAKLQGVVLESANLQETNLQFAGLGGANLQFANLRRANFQFANLEWANLRGAYLSGAQSLAPEQIKSACNWEKAIYKDEWNDEKKTWETIEPDNTNYIEELRKDKTSDPKEPPDCSLWVL